MVSRFCRWADSASGNPGRWASNRSRNSSTSRSVSTSDGGSLTTPCRWYTRGAAGSLAKATGGLAPRK